MNTFGYTAKRLAEQIETKERDYQLLLGFSAQGGQYRISVGCDHPEKAIEDAIRRIFSSHHKLTEALLGGIIKVAAAELEAAKRELRTHTAAHATPMNEVA